jgi:TPR repeat protein
MSEAAGRSLWREPILAWIFFGILAAALTVTAYNYGVHVGKSQASPVGQAAANPNPQKEPQSIPPSAESAPSVASDAPSAPNVRPSSPNLEASASKSALVNASKTADVAEPPLPGRAPGALTPGAHAEQASEAGNSQLAAALTYLNGENGARDSSKAAKQLWAAVGNGNSDAEVILAGLYVSGNGVAKNCEQGRVLLRAAMKSGNAQAKAKLAQLSGQGCP